MAEGQSFEKQHEISQPETGPEVDIESVLEKGEIESVDKLKGHSLFKVVKIKDDGAGLFRQAEGGTVWDRRGQQREEKRRDDLELLAYRIDRILGFNLVPETVLREVNSQKGTLQRFISEATPAVRFFGTWPELVSASELTKAAVFDFLIDAQDRSTKNFLINETTGKIWLVDHDYYMFQGIQGSKITEEARRRSLTVIPDDLVKAVEKLKRSIDALIAGSSDEVKQVLAGVRTRVQVLSEHKAIPV